MAPSNLRTRTRRMAPPKYISSKTDPHHGPYGPYGARGVSPYARRCIATTCHAMPIPAPTRCGSHDGPGASAPAFAVVFVFAPVPTLPR
ncbi:hypothetical protein EW145_g8396, partial [Phellinidium pouzarii]